MKAVFLDTAYAVALISRQDQWHLRALHWLDQLEAHAAQFVTTQAVLLEIGSSLSRLKYRPKAIELLAAYQADPRFDIYSITPELYEIGFELFGSRLDKEWSLVDCISFVVMKECGISDALTADEHFTQAGFRALLRSEP
jgi:predicted nucleic acid-binding protein